MTKIELHARLLLNFFLAYVVCGFSKRGVKWKYLSGLPPVMVRCLAREIVSGSIIRALSDEEIALRSGLAVSQVKQISRLKSWDTVTIGDAQRFCKGCDFDPMKTAHRNRAASYKRKNPKFTYLHKSPHYKSTFVELIKIIAEWRKEMKVERSKTDDIRDQRIAS